MNTSSLLSQAWAAHPPYGVSLVLLGRCLQVANYLELRKMEVKLRRMHLPRARVNILQREQALGLVEWDDRCEEVKVCTKGVTLPWSKWSLPKTP
jgi:hypothetical protein